MGKRRNSAVLRREQEQFTVISNKQNQVFYQKHKTQDTNTITFTTAKQKKSVNLIPKTINQEQYIIALQNPDLDVVVVSGPAGTGKTYLAMLAAIQAMRNKECERIILSRPAVGVDDEKHGFLPGDLNSKMEPWVRPLLDVLREFYSTKEIEYMLAEQIIEIAPLAFCRGRTFKNSWIILDESQNATPSQIKMILTRIGTGSKIIVTGDVEQGDRKSADNGLMDLESRLKKTSIPGLEFCKFTLKDVQRHRIIEHVLNAYSS